MTRIYTHVGCGGNLLIPRRETKIEGHRTTQRCGNWYFCDKCESMIILEIKIITKQEAQIVSPD